MNMRTGGLIEVRKRDWMGDKVMVDNLSIYLLC